MQIKAITDHALVLVLCSALDAGLREPISDLLLTRAEVHTRVVIRHAAQPGYVPTIVRVQAERECGVVWCGWMCGRVVGLLRA
jgi:hypothetical protein